MNNPAVAGRTLVQCLQDLRDEGKPACANDGEQPVKPVSGVR